VNRWSGTPCSLVTAAALVFLQASAAQALSISFDLDLEFSGATAPEGSTPWMRVTVDDSFGDANTVRLSIDALGLTGTESATGVYVNFDPSLDPTLLSFSVVDNASAPPNAISTGENAFKADGDGFFDVLFDFAPPGTDGDRLTAGESVVYDLVYGSPINASSFAYDSVNGGGNGTYRAAAHVQSIGYDGEDSGWIGAVPEPSTGLLVGLGLLVAARRRARA
jgi:hypothetical protein